MKNVLGLYAGVLGQPLLLLRLGGLMLTILVVYQIALSLMLESLILQDGPGVSQQTFDQNWLRIILGMLVYGIISIWLTTMFAIRWHRYALLGQSTYRFLDITFGQREWRFVWMSIQIGLLAGFVFFIMWIAFATLFGSTLVNDPANAGRLLILFLFLYLVPASYVIGRSALVYPATALGVHMRLRESWTKTKGHGLRIMVLLIAMTVPALISSELAIEIIPDGGLPLWLTTAIGTFVQTLFLLITTALWSSTFSYAYRALDLPLKPATGPEQQTPV